MKKILATTALTLALLGFGATSAMATDGHEAPAPTTPVLECGPWQVPGWLDENGNATGCVGDAPCPEALKGLPCPADIPAEEPVVVPEEPVDVPSEEPVLVPEEPVTTPAVPIVTPSEAPLAPVEVPVVEAVTPVEVAVVAPVVATEEVAETVPMLAETGSATDGLLLITSILVGSGLLLTVIGRKRTASKI